MNDALAIIVVILSACALMAGIGVGLQRVQRALDRDACADYASETGRRTKFIDYNYLSYECFTPSADGKWIPTSNLREIIE